jgi:hypothetical protein
MTSSEVAEHVLAEVGDNRERLNAHGCNLGTCLVRPEKRPFRGPEPGEFRDLWLVLEEDPVTRRGYKIVFDEENRSFGLAYPSRQGELMLLGFYGSFLDAYNGM